MATRLQAQRAESRRRLHQTMAVPALYLFGNAEPVAVTVRIHDKFAKTGDIPGLETVEMRDVSTRLRFWRDELPQPKRNAIISVEAGRAFRLGESYPHDNETIDVSATRLDATEADGLPVPA